MSRNPLDSEVYFWRLDVAHHAPTWDSGIGAERVGGRWNPAGVRVTYTSLDPATAILEVAVHKGFDALDTQPYVLTRARVLDAEDIYVLDSKTLPNPNWLFPGSPSRGQQRFGAELIDQHPFVLFPSSVMRHSWNLLMNPVRAVGRFELIEQEPFALDGRLSPPMP